MKLSLRCKYALLSMIYLSRQVNTRATSVSIGISQKISSEVLNEILITLVNEKYLRLARGNFGLARAAEKIKVIDIIRLFDGALASMEKEEKLVDLFSQLQDQIIEKLQRTTVADLI